jgi:polysaccharide pyruvyl transferase WcaK-like protein
LRHEIDTRTSGRRIAAVSATSSAPPFEANPVQGLKPETSERPVLACFLRDWPWAYHGTRSREEFERVKASFEDHLGEYIRRLCAESGCVPVLHPMHTYVEGGDDRVFARRFLAEQLADVPGARYVVEPSTVDSIITAMLDARLCICMRFHSVLFAHTARAPFLAIDYTNGGKIKGFLTDEGALDHRVALGDIARGDMANWEPIATRALRSLRA